MKVVATQQIRPLFERPPTFEELSPIFGIVGLDEPVVNLRNCLLDQLGCFDVERVPAVHAEVEFARRHLLTSGALNGPRRVGVVLLDLEAVRSRNLSVGGIREDGHVSRRDTAAPSPPMMLLEDRLVHPSIGKVTRRRLAEVGERNRLLDAGVVSCTLQDLPEHVVAHPLGIVEFRPQGSTRVVRIGVIVEPAFQVRHRRDQRDRPLAGLPVDGDLEAALVVRDVADGEVAKLSRPCAGIPRDGDDRRVSIVPSGIEHRLDVLVPLEHLSRGRLRFVVPGRRSGDPIDGVRDLVTVGDVLREHANRSSIIAIGLFVVVIPVDPPDELLGRVAIVDSVGQATDLLGHSDTASEEVLVTVIAVSRRQEEEPVREGDEQLAIGIGDLLALPHPIAKPLYLLVRVAGHARRSDRLDGRDVNLQFESGPTHYSAGADTPRAGAFASARNRRVTPETGSPKPHAAIATAGGVPA